MERFELTIVAQGPQSIWIAFLVVALLCITVIAMLIFVSTRYRLHAGELNQPNRGGGQHERDRR